MSTIKYQDLPEDRKEQIRNKHREAGLHDDWWEYVYEDAKEIGKQFGLDIEDIFFSGFWSQGDGVCYKGLLRFKECDESALPEEVRGVYQALHVVNSLLKIMYSDDYLFVGIKTDGRYSHEYGMDFRFYEERSYEADEIVNVHREGIEEALRDYARWIYKSLEAEYEYLNSDECIDEQLYDEEYDDEQETIGQDKYRIQ